MDHRRRDLLRLAAMAAGAMVLGCGRRRSASDGRAAAPPTAVEGPPDAASAPAVPTSASDGRRHATVVVIGAGMAGLAAARALVDAGVDAIVVEGRDRIGGRVWTDRSWPGVPLDLGASWIHGVRGNPLTALADRVGVRRVVTDYDDHAIRDARGRLLDARARRAIAAGLTEVLAQVDADAERRDRDRPLAAAIADAVADLDLSDDDRARLTFAVTSTIEHEYATAVDDLSQFERDFGDESGGDDVLLPDGYDQLTRALADGLDLRLGHAVERVAHGPDGVTITTSGGTFTADHALVTLPLGVLKAGLVEFAPALPAGKRAAIARLGVGLLDKVYLRFARRFWDDATLLGYVAPTTAPGQWAETLNLHKLTGAPVLLMFNAGAYAAAVEAMTDDDVTAAAVAALRAMYGGAVLPPEATRITRWGADRFARGSYSHLAPGATAGDLDALAAPVDARLFFAGEATHRAHPATVHGAYLSGLAAADAITRARGG